MSIASAAMLVLLLADAPLHFRAHILSVSATRLALETPAGDVFTAFLTHETKLLDGKQRIEVTHLRAGDTVDVDIRQNRVRALMLAELRLIRRRDLAMEDTLPSLKQPTSRDPEPGPPVLPAIPRDLVPPGRTHDLPYKEDLVERARDAALSFSEVLPNYLCQQVTKRFQSPTRPIEWKQHDVISAEIIYEDGRETYKNIALNDRVIRDAKMLGLGGTSSTGEFGTTLRGLFLPGAKAKFTFQHEGVMSDITTAVYDYSVNQPESRWKLMVEEQTAMPAYRGTLWLDKSNARVLRMEMEALDLPLTFRLSAAQIAVDYGYVDLGTERALLPVRAEVLVCYRGTPACDRNVIEWREYHRFLGESRLVVGKDNPPE